MTTTVTIHFGDGSFKEIKVTADHPVEAAKEARDWVQDNAWFEVEDASTNEKLAEVTLR